MKVYCLMGKGGEYGLRPAGKTLLNTSPPEFSEGDSIGKAGLVQVILVC